MSLDLKLIVDEFNLSLVKPSARSVYEFQEFRLDAEHLMLYRDNTEIPLRPKQVETLLALVERRGEIVSKDVLMSRLWGTTSVEESNLIQHIHFLRKVLGETTDGRQMIETLRRRGYRFNGKLREPESAVAARPEFRPQLVRNGTEQATNGASKDTGRSDAATSGSRILAWLGLLGLATGVAVLVYSLLGPSASPVAGKKHFAVLPPKPIDVSNRVERYELGVADALITRLNSIDGFIIRPLSETRKYTRIDQDPLLAGREQKVDYVLAPNYQLAEGKIRITIQLWNVNSGQVEDSFIFQKETSGIFAVQDAVAADVANRLMSRFNSRSNGFTVKRGTTNEEAYRLYHLGMALADKGSSNSEQAIESLTKALELDPNYANAWAGLARVVRPGYGTGLQTEEEHLRSLDAIKKALSIDPNLADAYVSLCDVRLFYDYDAAGAESACKRSLELDPNSADAHLTYSALLSSRLRMDEAFAEIKAAMDFAPASFRIQRQYANNLYTARRYADAEEQYKRLISFNTEGRKVIYRRLVRTLEALGKESEALEYVIKLEPLEGGDNTTVARLRESYATSGWRGVTVERIRLSYRDPKAGAFWRAQWYAYLGDNNKALENLEECLRNRNVLMMFLRGESHHFDSLRDDPRFEDLTRRVEVGFRLTF